MKKEHIALILVVFGIIGVFIIIGLSTDFKYTGLQVGKPNLQVNSIWIEKAVKTGSFYDNLVKFRVCNSGTADVVTKYIIRVNDINNHDDFAEIKGLPIRTGMCKDYSIKFGELDFYNKRNIEIKAFADSEDNIDELKEDDNEAYGKYDLLEFTPNLKINGVDVKGDKFYDMEIDLDLCNIPGNVMNDVKIPFNVDFTVNGVKKTIVVKDKILSYNCVSIRSPSLNDFKISKNNELNVLVVVNVGKILVERSYADNIFANNFKLGK